MAITVGSISTTAIVSSETVSLSVTLPDPCDALIVVATTARIGTKYPEQYTPFVTFDPNGANEKTIVAHRRQCIADAFSPFDIVHDGFASQVFHFRKDDIPNSGTYTVVWNKPVDIQGFGEAFLLHFL